MNTNVASRTDREANAATNYPTPPKGFAFNHQFFVEAGEVSWAGPIASAADGRLNVIFSWEPAGGAVAEMDLLPGDRYTVEQMRELHASLGAALAALEQAAEGADQ